MIYLKSPKEIEKILYINKIGAELRQICYDYIRPGIVTLELEEVVLRYCIKNNVLSSFKGYKGFPNNICVSVNEEVIHGFPSTRVINDGDIVSIDIGLKKNGYYSDTACTKIVGKVDNISKKLVKVTNECLYKGIEKAIPGNRVYDISAAIQLHTELMGFDVVREYVGHGVGFAVHEPPKIPNYVSHSINWKLRAGMVIAIEPILVSGSYDTYVAKNNWTVITKDHKMSAHFEHSIAITDNGPVILSQL